MDEKQKKQLANAGVKMQETAKKTAEQAEKVAGAAKKEWDKASPNKKKKIIGAVACATGILWLLRDGIGLKGAVFAMGLAACGWLVFCIIKKKSKRVPIILTTALLVIAIILPGSGGGSPAAGFKLRGSTDKQIEQITDWLEENYSTVAVVGNKYVEYDNEKLEAVCTWIVYYGNRSNDCTWVSLTSDGGCYIIDQDDLDNIRAHTSTWKKLN